MFWRISLLLALSLCTCDAFKKDLKRAVTLEFHMRGKTESIEDLPPHLQKLGLHLFGSKDRFGDILRNLGEPHDLKVAGVPIKLQQSRKDWSAQSLKKEMDGDHYGLHRVAKEDGLILDVGANLGDVTISAAKLHPDMQIVAFEPVPTTYFFLRKNMFENGVPEIEEADLGHSDKPGVLALNAVVRDTDGVASITYKEAASQDAGEVDTVGPHAFYSNGDSPSDWSTAEVPAFGLQNFLTSKGINKVGLLKMDCEGCEYKAIPGMRDMIVDRSQVKRFAAELHGGDLTKMDATESMRETDSLLAARGCQVKWIYKKWGFTDC